MKKNIHKSYFINLKSSQGFTLVELLAVITIFITVGVFITSIIVSTLRGNNKTNAIAAVQANGSYVMSQMSKLIRNVRSLQAPVSCGTIASPVSSSSISLRDADNLTTIFSCTTDGQNRTIIASNGA